jgi:hypothetical protein
MTTDNNGNNGANGNGEMTVAEFYAALDAREDVPFAFACPQNCFDGAGHGKFLIMTDEGKALTPPFTSFEGAMKIVGFLLDTGDITQTDVEKLTADVRTIPNLAETEAEFSAGQPAEAGSIASLFAAMGRR